MKNLLVFLIFFLLFTINNLIFTKVVNAELLLPLELKYPLLIPYRSESLAKCKIKSKDTSSWRYFDCLVISKSYFFDSFLSLRNPDYEIININSGHKTILKHKTESVYEYIFKDKKSTVLIRKYFDDGYTMFTDDIEWKYGFKLR